MPNEERDEILLGKYVATARKLQDGQHVAADAMLEFHGTTGLLLAHMYGQLWSKSELSDTINTTIDEKCAACKAARAIVASQAAPAPVEQPLRVQFARALCENVKTLAICIAVILTAAIAFNQLPALGDLIHMARTDTVVSTTTMTTDSN